MASIRAHCMDCEIVTVNFGTGSCFGPSNSHPKVFSADSFPCNPYSTDLIFQGSSATSITTGKKTVKNNTIPTLLNFFVTVALNTQKKTIVC